MFPQQVTHPEAIDLYHLLGGHQALRQTAQLHLQALHFVLQSTLLLQDVVHLGVDLKRQAFNLLVVGLQRHSGLLQLLALLLDFAGEDRQLVEGVVEDVELLEDVVYLSLRPLHELPQALAQLEEAARQETHIVQGSEVGASLSRGPGLGDGRVHFAAEGREKGHRQDKHYWN